MAKSSRPVLQVRNVPTGVPKFDDEPPSFIEREFGLDPGEPAISHIMRAAARLKIEYDIDVRDHPELLAKCIERGRREHRLEAVRESVKPLPVEPVIYYVRVGHLIKVGTSTSLTARMRAYPPGSTLLATEPGGYDVESERLRQFADSLAQHREWFHPSVALIEHINSLREQPLTAAELAA